MKTKAEKSDGPRGRQADNRSVTPQPMSSRVSVQAPAHQPAADHPRIAEHAKLQELIDSSPLQLAQAERLRSLFGPPAQPTDGDKPLQGRFDPLQRQEIEEDEPLQGKLDAEASAQLEADNGAPENKTGMPDQLKAGIEQLSGMDLSDVQVHRDSAKPAQVKAHAYAQGNDIHLGPGQEQHLPHEAWHLVQQRQGRVQPTMQMSGVQVNDDPGLEREADAMGEEALQMKANADGADGDASGGTGGSPIAVSATPKAQRLQALIDSSPRQLAQAEYLSSLVERPAQRRTYGAAIQNTSAPDQQPGIQDNKDVVQGKLAPRETPSRMQAQGDHQERPERTPIGKSDMLPTAPVAQRVIKRSTGQVVYEKEAVRFLVKNKIDKGTAEELVKKYKKKDVQITLGGLLSIAKEAQQAPVNNQPRVVHPPAPVVPLVALQNPLVVPPAPVPNVSQAPVPNPPRVVPPIPLANPQVIPPVLGSIIYQAPVPLTNFSQAPTPLVPTDQQALDENRPPQESGFELQSPSSQPNRRMLLNSMLLEGKSKLKSSKVETPDYSGPTSGVEVENPASYKLKLSREKDRGIIAEVVIIETKEVVADITTDMGKNLVYTIENRTRPVVTTEERQLTIRKNALALAKQAIENAGKKGEPIQAEAGNGLQIVIKIAKHSVLPTKTEKHPSVQVTLGTSWTEMVNDAPKLTSVLEEAKGAWMRNYTMYQNHYQNSHKSPGKGAAEIYGMLASLLHFYMDRIDAYASSRGLSAFLVSRLRESNDPNTSVKPKKKEKFIGSKGFGGKGVNANTNELIRRPDMTDPREKNKWKLLPKTPPGRWLEGLSPRDARFVKAELRKVPTGVNSIAWTTVLNEVLKGGDIAGHAVPKFTINKEAAYAFEIRSPSKYGEYRKPYDI